MEKQAGQDTAHVAMTHAPRTFTPVDHQLSEHGAPDPEPMHSRATSSFDIAPMSRPEVETSQMPEPVFRGGSFEPDPPAYVPPTLQATASNESDQPSDRPVPVVRVLSVRGVEYAFMTFMLWFGASSLIWLFVALLNGNAGFSVLSFPLSTLLISLPIFALLYIRLRKAELADPSLRLDASKRRFSQVTQIIAFLACFFNLTYLVFAIINKAGDSSNVSIGKIMASTAVVLVIAGGILTYYWFDEHKLVRK